MCNVLPLPLAYPASLFLVDFRCCFSMLTVSKKAKKGVSNGELGSSTKPGGVKIQKKRPARTETMKQNELIDLNYATQTTHIKTKGKLATQM